MENLKTKILMVVDSGLWISMAQKLTERFKKVYYFKQYDINGFPHIRDSFVGYGYDFELVDDIFYDYENVDCYFFTSLNESGVQEHLISMGKFVFGTGKAESMETDRWEFRKMLSKLELPRAECIKIKGLDKLESHLKTVKNKYVKFSKYRGLQETWHHISWEHSKSIVDDLRAQTGMLGYLIEFVVESELKSIIEIGYDGYTILGEYPDKTMFGFEIKDTCYLSKVMDTDDLPKVVRDINKKMKPYFRDYKMFYSNEIRMTSKTIGYLTDQTCRLPSPPGEIYIELLDNLAEIIYFGSRGEMIQPVFKAKFAGEIIICSTLLTCDMEQCVEVPKEIEQWVKFRYAYKMDGKNYCIPTLKATEVGVVVALGDSPEEVINNLKDYCSKIIAHHIEIKSDKLDSAIEQLSELEKIGIEF